MPKEYRSFWSYLGEGIATALVILAIILGVSGCAALMKYGCPNQPQPVEQKN